MSSDAYRPLGYQRRHKVDRGQELNLLRLQGHGVDLTLKVEDRLFPAHRFIVCLHSPYLKAMLTHGFKEAQQEVVEVKQVDPDVFGEVLEYMYTGNINVNLDSAIQLIELCFYLQMEKDSVVQTCLRVLQEGLAQVSMQQMFQVSS